VGEGVGGGDVLNGDIIGDDKFFKAGSEGIAKREVGFNEEGVGGGGDVEIGLKSTFGGDNGGANGGAGD